MPINKPMHQEHQLYNILVSVDIVINECSQVDLGDRVNQPAFLTSLWVSKSYPVGILNWKAVTLIENVVISTCVWFTVSAW